MKDKLILFLARKQDDEGFTLIEVLIVVIIISILSSLALVSYLSQVAKSREAEAKSNVSAIIRAQTAHFSEQNKFAPNLAELDLGIGDTATYRYSQTVNESTDVIADAVPQEVFANLRPVAGRVWVAQSTGGFELKSILCPGDPAAPAPNLAGQTACPGESPVPPTTEQ